MLSSFRMVQTKLSFSSEFMTAPRSKPFPAIFVHYCASSSTIAASFAVKTEALTNIRHTTVLLYAASLP